MIRSLSSGSPWVTVTASPTSLYVGNQQSAGMLRYNTQLTRIEVYDGTNWMEFGAHAEVSLAAEAQEIMLWAKQRMIEDQKFEALCAKHPGLNEAYERLQIMKQLAMQESRS